MFCNWLTEMLDGSDDNVVYTGIDASSWSDTTENKSRSGYRLPSSEEWEYEARYRWNDTINVITGNINGFDFSAMAPKYTKGNSSSGATVNYGDNIPAGSAVSCTICAET